MRATEILFLLSVAASAAVFAGRTLAEAGRGRGGEISGGPAAGTAGRPRDVDPGRVGRMIREGHLSDREALFYRRLGVSGEVFESSRKFQVLGAEAEVTVFWTGVPRGAGDAALRGMEESWRDFERSFQGEMERWRAAGPGPVRLGELAGRLLREAQRLHRETRGAFDVTGGPLLDLWKRAAGEGRSPLEAEIEEARSRSSWDLLDVMPEGARKKGNEVVIDLGLLARGHVVDRAVGDLQAAGAVGGRVHLGEVRRVFGRSPAGPWEVPVPHPFRPGGACARLAIPGGAVCLKETEGRPCLDPRTGRPVEGVFVAVVTGPTALESSAWAEALEVLGPEGLEFLPAGRGFEALVVGGSPESPRARATPGLRELLVSGPDF